MVPLDGLTFAHGQAPLQLLAGASMQDSLIIMGIGCVIAGCGIQTMRKSLRSMRARRRQQAQLESELNSFLTRLRAVINQPNRTDYSTAVDSAPRVAVEIQALLPHGVLAEHLISWWRFNLPDHLAIYDTLNELIIAHSIFDVAATRLDRCLIEAITEYNRGQKIDPLTDRLDLSFLIGRILGQPEDKLLAKMGISGKPLDFMRARCAALLTDFQVMQIAAPYLDARQRLEAAIGRLHELLKAQEPQPKTKFMFRREQAA